MKNFKDIINFARERGPKTISVACCQDKEVLMAVEMARKERIANSILIGDIEKTKEIAKEIDLDLSNYELIHIEDLSEASLKSVELVSQGKADMVMRGLVDTSIILKSVLDKEKGLRTNARSKSLEKRILKTLLQRLRSKFLTTLLT